MRIRRARGGFIINVRTEMRAALLALTLALITAAARAAADPVLLTSRRGGWIEAFDPVTLATVFRASTPANTDSVAADRSGARLYLSAPRHLPTASTCSVGTSES